MTPLQVLIACNGNKNKSFTPNTPNASGQQSSFKLDFSNQYTCIDYLINKGANVNAQDSYGLTALHYAAIKDNFEGAKHLIEKSVNIEIHVRNEFFDIFVLNLFNETKTTR